MDIRWRCERCECYNDERDNVCIVCGCERYVKGMPRKGFGGEITKTAEKTTPAVKEKQKASGGKTFLATVATIIAVATAGATGGASLAALAVPLVFLWKWALKKKK